jgi:hypothetical protein
MPTIYHAGLDRYHDVPDEKVAATYAASGWVDAASLKGRKKQVPTDSAAAEATTIEPPQTEE